MVLEVLMPRFYEVVSVDTLKWDVSEANGPLI